MPGTTWTKWYWADWMSDRQVRACGLAARGLWMDMLCIAAEHDPIGYVCVNGRPLNGQDLARQTGASVPEVESLLTELERNGVFTRDRNGKIYSRRMVRDSKKAAENRKNGKKGGNPTLGNTTIKSGAVNPPDNPSLKPHKPEASNHEPEQRQGVDVERWSKSAALVRVVHDLIGEVWGSNLRPTHPRPLDPSKAGAWLDAGATAAFVREVVGPAFEALKARGETVSGGGISYADKVIRAALEGRSEPIAKDVPADPAVEAACAEFVAASRKWSDNGRQGPSPKPEDFGMEQTPDGLRMTVGRAA